MNLVGPLDSEKLVEVVLLYVFNIVFPASLLMYNSVASGTVLKEKEPTKVIKICALFRLFVVRSTCLFVGQFHGYHI